MSLRAELTIDLDAIVANWRTLCEQAPTARVGAVVKADAYGLGAQNVAAALAAAGCRIFFVTDLEEAMALRPGLEDRPVLLLHGLAEGEEDPAYESGFIPVLNDAGQLRRWAELARRLGERLGAAIHVDTGMNRLGFGSVDGIDPTDLAAIEPVLVMSHLVAAEEPDHPLNAAQRERFEAVRAAFPNVPASLANSSGVFLGEPWHHQLCRPGYALYGGNPTPARPNPMQPVVSLVAKVLQIHGIEAAGSVGYGATYAVGPGMRIATVPLGYADGFPRSAGGRASVRISGTEVPIVGRVSMDLITLDVTALPESAVEVGTEVTLLGGDDGIDALAEAAGTNGYEVLTRLGRRYERQYLGGAEMAEEEG